MFSKKAKQAWYAVTNNAAAHTDFDADFEGCYTSVPGSLGKRQASTRRLAGQDTAAHPVPLRPMINTAVTVPDRTPSPFLNTQDALKATGRRKPGQSASPATSRASSVGPASCRPSQSMEEQTYTTMGGGPEIGGQAMSKHADTRGSSDRTALLLQDEAISEVFARPSTEHATARRVNAAGQERPLSVQTEWVGGRGRTREARRSVGSATVKQTSAFAKLKTKLSLKK